MIGSNHALAGGLIGKYLPLPLALPLALASHFGMDSLPHYGLPHHVRDSSRAWRLITIADFVAAAGLITVAATRHNFNMFAGGMVAVLPDVVWVGRVIKTRSFDLSNNQSRFTKWHAKIQKYERPWGIWLELPLVVGMLYLVSR